MKFRPVLPSDAAADDAVLAAEYASAEDFTPARVGTDHFFFRSGLRMYYLPLSAVRRVFRRVEIVNARVACCGNGLPMESVVLQVITSWSSCRSAWKTNESPRRCWLHWKRPAPMRRADTSARPIKRLRSGRSESKERIA